MVHNAHYKSPGFYPPWSEGLVSFLRPLPSTRVPPSFDPHPPPPSGPFSSHTKTPAEHGMDKRRRKVWCFGTDVEGRFRLVLDGTIAVTVENMSTCNSRRLRLLLGDSLERKRVAVRRTGRSVHRRCGGIPTGPTVRRTGDGGEGGRRSRVEKMGLGLGVFLRLGRRAKVRTENVNPLLRSHCLGCLLLWVWTGREIGTLAIVSRSMVVTKGS